MARPWWQNRRNIKIIISIIGALFVGAQTLYHNYTTKQAIEEISGGSTEGVNALLTDNRVKYTKHARERMKCRFIDESEVEFIMREGKVNLKKSDPRDQPCGTYAMEGMTKDNQEVRIVFADCPTETKVITAIDLTTDHGCH